jgi:hypothetical protein
MSNLLADVTTKQNVGQGCHNAQGMKASVQSSVSQHHPKRDSVVSRTTHTGSEEGEREILSQWRPSKPNHKGKLRPGLRGTVGKPRRQQTPKPLTRVLVFSSPRGKSIWKREDDF